MPRACATGPGRLTRPEAFGLESVYGSGRSRRRIHWVRSGPDAVMVQCALATCRVWAAARFRFRSPPGGVEAIYDPDVRDYRAKPLDYLLVEGAIALAGLLIIGGALVLFLGGRSRR